MLEISIALVVIACIAAFLVNKYLDQQHAINIKSSKEEVSAAIEEGLKVFDDRINKTWGTISEVKQELNALKLQIGFRNKQ